MPSLGKPLIMSRPADRQKVRNSLGPYINDVRQIFGIFIPPPPCLHLATVLLHILNLCGRRTRMILPKTARISACLGTALINPLPVIDKVPITPLTRRTPL